VKVKQGVKLSLHLQVTLHPPEKTRALSARVRHRSPAAKGIPDPRSSSDMTSLPFKGEDRWGMGAKNDAPPTPAGTNPISRPTP
jgi:hypothetical protein